MVVISSPCRYFPSFWEGLSLRLNVSAESAQQATFPFLLGGTFIEAPHAALVSPWHSSFPFLLGGTFIEALQ